MFEEKPRPTRALDFAQVAHRIVEEATKEKAPDNAEAAEDKPKEPQEPA